MLAPEYQQAVEYFEGEELSGSVFIDKYALRDFEDNLVEFSPDEMHCRIARELARVEKKKFKNPYSEEYIYSLLKDFGPIIPQGSPMYGIGNLKYVTISNCYVLHPPIDSYGGIHRTDEELTQICKRRGGVGFDISHIRPAGMPTTNSSRTSTGIVPFMERFSNSIREVGQNGRRGALMITISVHHPQVLDFANCKKDKTKVTGANISIRLSDEFLYAVKNNEDYEQRWPIKGVPVISRKVNAREVWMEIIQCAHEMAEPGLLFWDMILRESPADCYADCGFETVSTNPCSELPLSILDSCRLLLKNLFCYVKHPFTPQAEFDFEAYYAGAQVAQRLMDDIIDLEEECIRRIIAKIESDPEDEDVKSRELSIWKLVLENCLNGRRTGTGITALGDTLAALGIPYGSDESIEMTSKIYRTLKLGCYRSSVDMAKELGPFPVWNKEKEKDNPFLLRIRDEDPGLYADMQKYGRRNIALLTTAPAGSVSIEAGPRPYFQTTSGIEPLFQISFKRRKKINPAETGARVDFVDQNGDKWQEFIVYHPKVKMWMDVTGETDVSKSPYYGCCAEDLDWKQRVKLQAAAQQEVDHAISSTINLPEDVSVERVAEIYETAWEAGCKGITVYRKNCRTGVLVDVDEKNKKLQKTNAPKRPQELPCDIHLTKIQGEEYFVLVGLFESEPYEVMAGPNLNRNILERDDYRFKMVTSLDKVGVVRKEKRGHYDLYMDNELAEKNVSGRCDNDQEALTRMVSTALRHGADIGYVVHQLEKVRGDMYGFARALSRVLKKYVPDGTEIKGDVCQECQVASLKRQEGCVTCSSCGWTKCL